jgi:hypothetical protein
VNDPRDHKGWGKFRLLATAFPTEAEKGRLIAAHEIANNAEARKRVEDAYGIEFCRLNYPEAYRYEGRLGGLVKFLDGVRDAIPW